MDKIIGIDIGGSHISGALVDAKSKRIVDGSFYRLEIDPETTASEILTNLQIVITKLQQKPSKISGIAVSIPGPFDYINGISEIRGVGKFSSLFGLNLKQSILTQLNSKNTHISFQNDATAYLQGEIGINKLSSRKILGITLGTGFGSSFFHKGEQVKNKLGVPRNGFLFDQPFKNSLAEDYFSTRWFVNAYKSASGEEVAGVKELSKLAKTNRKAIKIFEDFGRNLAIFLKPYLQGFHAENLLIGGNVSKASSLFLPAFKDQLKLLNYQIEIVFCEHNENAPIIGASAHLLKELKKLSPKLHWRKTEQYLLPDIKPKTIEGAYDIYPSYPLGNNKIRTGFSELASEIKNHKNVIVDGYVGVFWEHFISKLAIELKIQNTPFRFYNIASAMKSQNEILQLSKMAMGEKDSIFGKKYPGQIIDFFDSEKLNLIQPDNAEGINIIYGCGASLADWNGLLLYVDLPKNEIQFRSRAGSIANIGFELPIHQKEMYKRFYFIDWIVLNRHKEKIFHKIDILIDEQRHNKIQFVEGNIFRDSLAKMSEGCFRVRPWFEPGPWGGSWIKSNIQGLATNVPNYAWSFELIVPENGILMESSGKLLEFSFDFLMYAQAEKVLGDAYRVFKHEFPIRFDFLDTFDGGNLSVQCHPRPEYIKAHFGETFTQDETYYILDAKEGSEVYLGFQEDINPSKFRKELEDSFTEKKEINIPDFIQVHPSKKHDLFLIPNGTIHASGKNNLVLEISSTPYIFTYKMYDWLRLDLDGKPRPINIEHAYHNLYFNRKGDKVKDELISQPQLLDEGDGFKVFHLPTHEDHFYDVHRIEFYTEVGVETNNKCHVCMLVEGESIILETTLGNRMRMNYAETFVIPAATEKYKLINRGIGAVKLIKAFVKDNFRI